MSEKLDKMLDQQGKILDLLQQIVERLNNAPVAKGKALDARGQKAKAHVLEALRWAFEQFGADEEVGSGLLLKRIKSQHSDTGAYLATKPSPMPNILKALEAEGYVKHNGRNNVNSAYRLVAEKFEDNQQAAEALQ